ncbi:hypothetical protein K1719_021054 [Acacia pycnantha]|nr:hypothetical protein K1719_021054 [Acacia pycnantha]
MLPLVTPIAALLSVAEILEISLGFKSLSGMELQNASPALVLQGSQQNQGSATMATGAESKPKKKICCACPDTKRLRDECIVEHGESACAKWIENHRLKFQVNSLQEQLKHDIVGFTMGTLWRSGASWNLSIFLCTIVRSLGAVDFVLISSFLLHMLYSVFLARPGMKSSLRLPSWLERAI